MKIIFINWRWREGTLVEYSVKHDNIIFISAYESELDLSKFINTKLISFNPEFSIIFTHTTQSNIVCIPKDKIKIIDKYLSKTKIIEFSGNEQNNKQVYSLFDQTTEPLIHTNNFEFVWNYFLGGKVLEEQKNKLINIFLPLAIDQKGLGESSSEKTKNNYLNEVQDYLSKNAEYIISAWNEMKITLGLNVEGHIAIDTLSEIHKLSNEEKALMYFPIESEECPVFSKESLIDYIISFKEDSGIMPITSWLIRAVGILSKKINPDNTNE